MANNIIYRVDRKNVTLARATIGAMHPCTFCGSSTSRVIAHSEDRQNWGVLPTCDKCMGSLKKLPVTDDDKPEEPVSRIIKPS